MFLEFCFAGGNLFSYLTLYDLFFLKQRAKLFVIVGLGRTALRLV